MTTVQTQSKHPTSAAKPIKYVVAVILRDAQHPDRFLVVKRPSDDPDLRGHWGLPAVTLQAGELPENGAQRVCWEKLNCAAVPTRFIGTMFQKRNSYDICLMDIEMTLVAGAPDCTQSNTKVTKYVEQKWTNDPMELMASAAEGSCCSSIFLTDQGLLDRDEWIASLEGSKLVG
jgi:hypothetical protein